MGKEGRNGKREKKEKREKKKAPLSPAEQRSHKGLPRLRAQAAPQAGPGKCGFLPDDMLIPHTKHPAAERTGEPAGWRARVRAALSD